MPDANTATLPEGPKVDKNTEITPDPEVLAREAYVLVEKPESKVVLVYGKSGRVVARYFDAAFAREEVKEAGLKWDLLLAGNRLKQEKADRDAARRKFNRPDRRLRSERRKGRGAEKPEPAETAAGE